MNGANVEGSGKASSYLRALDLLGPILAGNGSKFFADSNVWAIESVEQVAKLYEYILEQQRLGDDGIFRQQIPSSYWRNRYYSAALKSYKQFLILHYHEERLWQIVREPEVTPVELSRRLARQRIESIEELVPEQDVDFSKKAGKERLLEVKTRINQEFFRKMIISTYQAQCCVTGLNIPAVLRASHIVAWADDEENRLNPANGLCLSATYDAAFDRHLISLDEDCRLILSPVLNEYCSNDAFKTQFKLFEGCEISRPKRFSPDQKFLEKHRNKLPT